MNSFYKLLITLAVSLCALFSLTACDNNKITITGIELVEGSIQSEYLQNSEIDFSDAKIIVTYSDKSTKEINYSDLTINTVDTSTIGLKNVTITYKKEKITIVVSVVEKLPEITSIAYKEGLNNKVEINGIFDTSNLKVTAYYDNDTSKVINKSDLAISNIDTTTKGKQMLTITYAGKSIQYEVTVLGIKNLVVKNNSIANTVIVKESLNLTSAICTATLDDDTTKDVSFSQLTFGTLDTTTIGAKKLNITYNGFTTQYDIEVCGIKSMTVKQGTLAQTVRRAESLNTANVVVVVTYTNDVTREKNASFLTFGAFDTSTKGLQNLSITYDGVTINFPINVASVQGITITNNSLPTKIVRNATLSTASTTAIITYDDNITTKNVVASDLTFGTFDTTTKGVQSLSITYDDFEYNYPINVLGVQNIIITANTIPSEILRGETLDLSAIIATIIYDDDNQFTKTFNDLTLGDFDTTVIGEQNLAITYDDYTAQKSIKVLDEGDVLNVYLFESNLVKSYNANSGEQDNKQEEFAILNKTMLAGDDNVFDLQIIASGEMPDETLLNEFKRVRTSLELKIYNSATSQYDIVAEENVVDYLTFDSLNNKISWKPNSIGKNFMVSVSPLKYASYMFDEAPTVTITVDVIDGYNVYNANDLCVMDNSTDHGWNAFKEQNGYGNTVANNIILQKDIQLTKNNIPSFFVWQSNEVTPDMKTLTTENIVGSLKNYYGHGLYTRRLQQNESFNMYGNYFQLNLQNLPRVVIESVNGAGIKVGESQQAITVNSALFYVSGENTNYTTSAKFETISFLGNGQRSADAIYSGGIVLAKLHDLDFIAQNTIYTDCFIGYMFEVGKNNSETDRTEYLVKDCKGYNCYNTLMYMWGASHVLIEDSEFIGAGGPVMIVDHKDNDKNTGAGGNPTYIDMINSTMISYVNGNEPWFVTYGASTAVSQIAAANAFYNGTGGLPNTEKSILKNASGINNMMNMVAVYKSGSDQGMTTSVVRGRITSFATRNDYETQYGLNGTTQAMTSYGLDFERNGNSGCGYKARSSGNVYFECSGNGGYINQGFGTANTDASYNPMTGQGISYYEGKHINLYLPNGMGAMIELFNA